MGSHNIPKIWGDVNPSAGSTTSSIPHFLKPKWASTVLKLYNNNKLKKEKT